MRVSACVLFVGTLAACGDNRIDAGTNTAGGDAAPAVVDAGPDGPVRIASLIQQVPTQLLSDGTTLFWVSDVPEALAPSLISSAPVDGGSPSTVVSQPADASAPSVSLIGVDDSNVYYLTQSTFPQGGAFYRAPKNGGGSPVLIASAQAAAVHGTNLYWVENDPDDAGTLPTPTTLKTAPFHGGPVSTLAQLTGVIDGLAVTANTVFLLTESVYPPAPGVIVLTLASFSIGSGALDGVAAPSVDCPDASPICCQVDGYGQTPFLFLASDKDSVYCVSPDLPSILRVSSDGTTTALGDLVDLSTLVAANLAIDDTYVYWADPAPVGTIMRVPKTGGTPTVVARASFPLGVAVDATSLYWSDRDGNLWRLAK